MERATTDMSARFDKLAGESLKKPLLQLFTESGPLDGRVFMITNHPNAVQIGPIFAKNVGTKRTDTLGVRLYSSADIKPLSSQFWEPIASNDSNYKFSWYQSGRIISIDATETWTLENSFGFVLSSMATNISFKIAVFYGVENPTEAEFSVQFK